MLKDTTSHGLCSLASRRQVWCLLSAAIRPPVSPVGSPLESGVSPAHIGPRNACPREGGAIQKGRHTVPPKIPSFLPLAFSTCGKVFEVTI